MTDYIEEMMKTAKVEADSCCAPIGADCSKGCDNCQRNNITYPTFTPEKQLEIIKLIANKKGYAGMGELLDWYSEIDGLNLTQALAQLTTKLMEAEHIDKDKIKEILER